MLSNKKTYKNDNLRNVQKTFNDGVCEVFEANERVLGQKLGTFRFAYESVGIAHFYQAYNNNVSIDSSISIPCNDITLNSQDIVLIEGVYFKIARIQYHDNKKPHYWTLSLQRSPFNYVVEVENG